jgi:hypothetical protein
MTLSPQRLAGVVTLSIAVLLFVLSVTSLVHTAPTENARGLEFLPVKHESVSIQVGSAVLELSRSQASQIVMAISVLLVIIGGLLLWRSAKARRL